MIALFRISQFDMLSGSDVHFWGSIAPDFDNFTNGFMISDYKLNETYKNASFSVNLSRNVTWDRIRVLSIFDLLTESEFGHVILSNGSDLAPALSPDLAPSPASNDSRDNEGKFGPFRVPTMLDNCKILSNDYRIRWSLSVERDFIDIGLEAAIAIQNYMAFGWSDQKASSEVMIGGDVAVAGFTEKGMPFVDDFYITQEYDGEALGLMRPPDTFRPYYSPQNHGGPMSVTYGHLVLNVSEQVNECLGPLDAADKEDQDLIIADANKPLVVTTGPAVHYPNPPNPSKVLYINKKEAPVLKVERGVPVRFSVQAGHDVALYITTDLIGGNATSRNKTETIYAGGPEAEGVLASPMELIWEPDRNTPDQKKMGWRVQVADGGLSDMYNNSVLLDDQQVTFFWTLSKDSISIAARGEKKSGYIAIGFGTGMGWVDDTGKGHVSSYWIDGRDASRVHPTNENLTNTRCKSENGIITFEFIRPLKPCSYNNRVECKNIIDPTTPLKVIWALGTKWSDEHLNEKNMHSETSHRPIRVLLMGGSAKAEQDLRPVLAVHGFMMFLSWGILLPGGILAARYLKHVKGGWLVYQIHVSLQCSGLLILLLGLLFAVAELRGLYISSAHVKLGLAAIFLACVQPVNASMRPKKSA
ncbi:hypothetical protein OIU77_031475 [Salix suchowensis]|uniref:Uncharacterized protein n=1 Tax=Salix suchowensis TaxID=1278906 RepID=A0ABQ9BJ54_9ROSI|nr:hypothetical protein OIU77_031475 [Salix suchowensis]